MKKKPADDRTVCRNRKAKFDFDLIERFECGIVLTGPEVKSLRDRNASLNEAFARIIDNELWLVGLHIASYKFAHSTTQESLRRRKLLIHRRELNRLQPKLTQKGLTLVPLRVYFNERGIAKVELSVGRGRSRHDRRQALQKREDQRDMDRAIKARR